MIYYIFPNIRLKVNISIELINYTLCIVLEKRAREAADHELHDYYRRLPLTCRRYQKMVAVRILNESMGRSEKWTGSPTEVLLFPNARPTFTEMLQRNTSGSGILATSLVCCAKDIVVEWVVIVCNIINKTRQFYFVQWQCSIHPCLEVVQLLVNIKRPWLKVLKLPAKMVKSTIYVVDVKV